MKTAERKKKAIVFWLVPAKAEEELFSNLIRILARQLNAPQFEPHLTICAAPDTRSLQKAIKEISMPPMRLQVQGPHASNRFTKTLFIRFRRSRALNNLSAALRRAAKLPRGAVRDPHISLLYKRMPMAAKRELVSTINLPFEKVAFDAIKAVRCNYPTESAADVEGWQVVASKPLRD